jgi:hypothetical protein
MSTIPELSIQTTPTIEKGNKKLEKDDFYYVKTVSALLEILELTLMPKFLSENILDKELFTICESLLLTKLQRPLLLSRQQLMIHLRILLAAKRYQLSYVKQCGKRFYAIEFW